MFVEQEEDKGMMICGFQLQQHNWYYSPKGTIRIARFENNFSPYHGNGYYADTYFKDMVRKWKKKYNRRRRQQIKREYIQLSLCIGHNLCQDILRQIYSYL